ncbi:MAG: hypothetical protein A2Z02_05585 [Chloroflexi bacterium RBG_16_48_7]|nr:MAG: hypothetical protein A2Z02_05585 [Chloroflexi bacterium RBG_16_48_7]
MIRKNTIIRKKQIIEASRTIIVKYGSENVTIRRIAEEVGITEGAIYRHFKSKKEVLSGLADFAIDSLLQDISDLSSVKSGDPDTVTSLIDKHLLDIEKRKGASFQVIAEIISFGDKKLNKKIYDGINLYIDQLKQILTLHFAGRAKTEEIEAATFLLFSLIQGLVNVWTLSNYCFDLHERYLSVWNMYNKRILMA